MQHADGRYVLSFTLNRCTSLIFLRELHLVAIDVWSAGIILLFFLTKKFPLFQASDDVEALMEIATIMGKKRMERAATLHSMLSLSSSSTAPDSS